MKYIFLLLITCIVACYQQRAGKFAGATSMIVRKEQVVSSRIFNKNSWQYFLQHLPVTDGPILDYTGHRVAFQEKHTGIVNYDVGTRDLQQCADALIRLRAEYLYSRQRYNEIGFHFVNGKFYTWNAYCKGIKIISNGRDITTGQASAYTHESLRKYLDIVYEYASTISLAKELKAADNLAVGTVIIHPGSPGHCFKLLMKQQIIMVKKFLNLWKAILPHNPFMF